MATEQERNLQRMREAEAIKTAMETPGGQIIKDKFIKMFTGALNDLMNTKDTEVIIKSQAYLLAISEITGLLGSAINWGEHAKNKLTEKLYPKKGR